MLIMLFHPLIDSEVNGRRHFVKIPFLNKIVESLIYHVSLRIDPSHNLYPLISSPEPKAQR